ncbi:T-cell surface glycoprotein CD3 epsilon chain isoform X2 [Hyla sarda]|uniref:T-cell surface glycoprotein CD3 epsilon chain isoform X2 n=1 Tax=Hyla sarda TaxID=327740 RepID=UPI0024C37D07|nr:T-cell surface glycoprotein CD3 epsilon chain isoform X2 [Hyla sarda]
MKPWIILSLLLVGLYFDQSSADGEDTELSTESKKEIQVSITGLKVEISCPKEGDSLKKITDNDPTGGKPVGDSLDKYTSDKNGLYQCDKDYLYLHAYVCETCTEVTVAMLVIFVIADCLITIGVCLIVYMFCKRKPGQVRESGYSKGARNKGNKERPPPVPNPDYEPIQKRRQDVYDGLNQGLK